MPEYIERDALLTHAIALNNPHELGENVVPVSDIEAAPAADVVHVVHCGDCKFRCDFTDGHCECRRWPNIPMSYQRVDPQFDFCSYGERKDGAE